MPTDRRGVTGGVNARRDADTEKGYLLLLPPPPPPPPLLLFAHAIHRLQMCRLLPLFSFRFLFFFFILLPLISSVKQPVSITSPSTVFPFKSMRIRQSVLTFSLFFVCVVYSMVTPFSRCCWPTLYNSYFFPDKSSAPHEGSVSCRHTYASFFLADAKNCKIFSFFSLRNQVSSVVNSVFYDFPFFSFLVVSKICVVYIEQNRTAGQ